MAIFVFSALFSCFVVTILFLFDIILCLFGGRTIDINDPNTMVGIFCTTIFVLWIVWVAISESARAETKGRQCRASCLNGLPGFKREQAVNLTLDIKNTSLLFDDLKGQKVALRLQQITKLSYIDWKGDVSRWVPGSSGYSYPGLFEGTRHYVPPTEGYFKTETLQVNRALEIRYRDQGGVPQRIVLDISKDRTYAEALMESLCRCTSLPEPQYVPLVKPSKPGPTYL